MDPSELLEALQDPADFPGGGDAVEVRQTHCSVVFLVGEGAYKIKKPVDLGFLDFSTAAKRREACEAEVRLNRRLAPGVYRDVLPLTRQPGGGLRVGGDGEVVDWVVPMRRLPDAATFLARLEAGNLEVAHLDQLARRLADFYASVAQGPEEHEAASYERVAAHLEGTLDPLPGWAGEALAPELVERLQRATATRLQADAARIRRRAAAGVGREGHGDLRLDHVYLLPEEDPPLVVLDGVEFSHELRSGDPLQDIAFLVMELEFHGRPDLGQAFAAAFGEAAEDPEGAALLPLYVGYRHLVRGKVRWLESLEEEIPAADRARDRGRAHRHWLGALDALAPPGERPALVMVGGLPGTGKSTVSRALEERGFSRVSTDQVRRELAGLGPTEPTPPERKAEIYSAPFNERTYREVLRRVEERVRRGERVIMDATFTKRARRHEARDVAERLGVRHQLVIVEVEDAVARERLEARRGDESDAGTEVYDLLRRAWEPDDAETGAIRRTLRNDGTPEECRRAAEDLLVEAGLLEAAALAGADEARGAPPA